MARTLYGLFMNDEEPMTPEQIAGECGLPLEAVHEAIAYCQTDPPEIREDWQREEALIQASRVSHPDDTSESQPRLLSPQEINRILRG
jgi:hypothetical protein